jgi:hypothetical protein
VGIWLTLMSTINATIDKASAKYDSLHGASHVFLAPSKPYFAVNSSGQDGFIACLEKIHAGSIISSGGAGNDDC